MRQLSAWIDCAMEPEVYKRMAELEERHWWFLGRRRILASVIGRIPLPSPARILDVGCGTGGNLAMLSTFGEVQGFEPDPLARELASRKGHFSIHDGSLPDRAPFEPASFDLVAALDTIEHMADDLACLQALTLFLKPGGFALLTVPANPRLWSRHDELHHHHRRYRRAELLATVRASGLDPVLASHYNTLLYPALSGVRLTKNLLKSPHGDDAMPRLAIVNHALRKVFAAERLLIGRAPMPFGASLLVVARKPV